MTRTPAARTRHQRGSAIVEMTMIGIPLIFTLISIFEISRGMWIFHTLAYSVKDGVRFASVHGINCINNPPGVPNNCPTNIAAIANVIKDASVGLDPNKTLLSFTANGGTATLCYMGSSSATNINPDGLGAGVGCQSLTTQWPPSGSNNVGYQIKINIRTPFRSAISMLWPGARRVSFAQANLGATSTDSIQF